MPSFNDLCHVPIASLEGLAIQSHSEIYSSAISSLLRRVFPFRDIHEGDRSFVELLPLISYTTVSHVPANMSVVVVFKNSQYGPKFIFEMLSRWLVPGKSIHLPLMFTADFTLPKLSDAVFCVCEAIIHIPDSIHLEEVQRNLPIVDTEIRLGITSRYFARRIMEVKGLTSDEKIAQIQEYIAYLVERNSANLDFDVFNEMQHLLVMCREEFKQARKVRHLSRIIIVKYLFRKNLRHAIKANPEKRHFFVKLGKEKIEVDGEEKEVLTVVLGINFLRDKEIFEQRHLLKAIQLHIPLSRIVDHSFFINRHGSEQICTLYAEVEKSDGTHFSTQEIQLLRTKLPEDLEERIEHLMYPIFNPRNEEEIMRNILSLSSQIKFIRDMPQVFINFDEQTEAHVYFTIIVVRVIKEGTLSIQSLFEKNDTIFDYIPDRCRCVGVIRKKYPKEATVFRVRLRKGQFLRKDHSIDLYKARQTVVRGLYTVLGEFRDFNGGMISKQSEALNVLRGLLVDTTKCNDLLLENFYYSVMPVIMRTVLEPETLKTLYLMLLEAIDEGFVNEASSQLKIVRDHHFVYAMMLLESPRIEEEIRSKIEMLKLPSTSLAISYVKVFDNPYLGFIFRSDDPNTQQEFCDLIMNNKAACRQM